MSLTHQNMLETALHPDNEIGLSLSQLIKTVGPATQHFIIQDPDYSATDRIERALRSVEVGRAFKSTGFTLGFRESEPAPGETLSNRMTVHPLEEKIQANAWRNASKSFARDDYAPVISAMAEIGLPVRTAEHTLIDSYITRVAPDSHPDQRERMINFLNSTDARVAVRLDSDTSKHMTDVAKATFQPMPAELILMFGGDKRTDMLFMTGNIGQETRSGLRDKIIRDEMMLRRLSGDPEVARFINETAGNEKSLIIAGNFLPQRDGTLLPDALHVGIHGNKAEYDYYRQQAALPTSQMMNGTQSLQATLIYLADEKKLYATAATPDDLAEQLRAAEKAPKQSRTAEFNLG